MKEDVLPPAGALKTQGGRDNKPHFYNLNGITHKSPELVFSDLPIELFVSRSQEFQIWYGQDWIDLYEDSNSGAACVDVYAWICLKLDMSLFDLCEAASVQKTLKRSRKRASYLFCLVLRNLVTVVRG